MERAQVLGSPGTMYAGGDSDKILALLESETSRLQNLIHRYINQPSRNCSPRSAVARAVLGTLTTRASTGPMLSGSVKDLTRHERFLTASASCAGGRRPFRKL